MSIEIKHWYDGKVLYTAEDATDVHQAVVEALLSGADLRYAVLRYADLSGAVLSGALLRGADLRYADLRDAVLRGAVLSDFRDDLWDVLDKAPAEVRGLREKLRAGEIHGAFYSGPCACLVGTIANLKGCNYQLITGITPDPFRPAEAWFMPIRPGDWPDASEPASEGSFRARLAVQWIDEWVQSRAVLVDGAPR